LSKEKTKVIDMVELVVYDKDKKVKLKKIVDSRGERHV